MAVNGLVLLLVILFLPNGIVSLAGVLRARRTRGRPTGGPGDAR
jgi:hypothetical protein